MINHRTPRAHLSGEAQGEDPAGLPAVTPAVVEFLEREFPIELSPRYVGEHTETAIDQAEQRGRQQVIERLRSISKNQE
jgi:hypothetical protein